MDHMQDQHSLRVVPHFVNHPPISDAKPPLASQVADQLDTCKRVFGQTVDGLMNSWKIEFRNTPQLSWDGVSELDRVRHPALLAHRYQPARGLAVRLGSAPARGRYAVSLIARASSSQTRPVR